MSLLKAVGYMLVLLAIFYTLEKQGYRQSVNVFFEELMSTKASHIQAREKRAAALSSSLSSTEYVIQAIINISSEDLLRLRTILSTANYPLTIESTVEITSIDLTTVCSPNMIGYQCRCEENFAWSYNSCIANGACDAIIDNTCGCIDSLPADNQYCQLNLRTPAPSPTPPNVPVNYDLVLDLTFPVSASSPVPDVFFAQLMNIVQSFFLPYTITQSLNVTGINVTTACYPNATGELQCECEQQFAWSCNKCKNYGACSNDTTQSCGCLDTLPYDGEFCEPAAGVTMCPAPTPAPSPTPPNVPVNYDLVLDLTFPVSASSPVPDVFFAQLMNIVQSFFLPYTITQSLNVTGINVTTACYPNATGELQCECEQQFAWSCNKCKNYGACSNDTTQSCGCLDTLPYDGEFCEPAAGVTMCPAPTPAPSPTPPNVPVNYDLVLDLTFPVSASSPVPDVFFAQLMNIVQSFFLPYTITQSLNVTGINVTTACYPNATGELQCECEQQFAWSCNKCKNYGACSNDTTQSCGCLDTLPYDGEFCEPAAGVTMCPAPTPAPSPTPPNVPVNYDLVLDLTFPVSASSPVPDVFFAQLMNIVQSFFLPYTITQSLNVTGINVTTACYPNATGELQCECEQQFAWSCNKCKNYGACSNDTTQSCGCLDTLPYDGEFCEPAAGVTMCPAPTPAPSPTPPNDFTMYSISNLSTTTTTLTSTTPITTTLTTPLTTPAITQVGEKKNGSFTMNLIYNSSFNSPSNKVYQDISNAIKTQCNKYISTLISADLVTFRSGSTIADYTMTATSFQVGELEAVKSGIFTQLGGTYPIIFSSSKPLTFAPQTAFYGNTLTVTCVPQADISFGNTWTAEWLLDGSLIPTDSRYMNSIKNGTATLTISNVIQSDTGVYTCQLTRADYSSFLQDSITVFTVNPTPVIQVFPVNMEVKCVPGNTIPMWCSVNSPYVVQFADKIGQNISYLYTISSCDGTTQKNFICQVTNLTSETQVQSQIQLKIANGPFTCQSAIYGVGNEGQTASVPCTPGEVGQLTAICLNSNWQIQSNNCILQEIYNLLVQSQYVTNTTLATFLKELSNVTSKFSTDVVESPANVNATVQILHNVANATVSLSITITNDSMRDILITAGILTTAKTSWQTLNNISSGNISVTSSGFPQIRSVSSEFLQSLEFLTHRLTNDSFDVPTPYILLNKTTISNTFSATFNTSVDIAIPETGGVSQSITVITFSSMDNVLPARDKVAETNSTNVINGRVVLVQSNGTINDISFKFDVIDDTLGNPRCVFWNFSLFNGLGGWDNEGCQVVTGENQIVTCNCTHLTSFSILMSPYSPDDPVLDYITYIGVGISMASLVICLIIEAVIWRKINKNNTSYLRHVSIVNIAVSLLIADIWFIVGAAISAKENENISACSTAAFFIHYFYLALFFWMLASALLLLYRTVSVFEGGLSKISMLAIGFILGYGVPLIIVIITIAVTAPKQQYIQGGKICWLNWNESKALLAFVIPALTIVLINLIILLVVIYKILRRRAVRDTAHAVERNALMVIARTLAVLTPFFGITWGLGVGTMVNPHNRGINIAFAFFNSLQGFFILVFGTLLDKKVRSELAIRSQIFSSGTRSTSAGNSTSGLGFFRNWRRGRDGYNVSSSASGAVHSFANSS